MKTDNPILNNPFEIPKRYYHTDLAGQLDYDTILDGRRVYVPPTKSSSIPTKQGKQKALFSAAEATPQYNDFIINVLRREMEKWRSDNYPNVTNVSRDLLHHWFLPKENTKGEKEQYQKLFFAQREAIETAIWINECADKSNMGNFIKTDLDKAWKTISEKPEERLPRVAFKMATGTGKTVVMASLIVYHFFNRQSYPQDTRFADNFLLVAPGVTIRDRLNVLKVDVSTTDKNKRRDYYAERDLIPNSYDRFLPMLNQKLAITNYHTFEPKILQGNKRGVTDGKWDEKQKKKKETKESFAAMFKRILPASFTPNSRILVLNDEAHHCYLPKPKTKEVVEDGDSDTNTKAENERAAVWYRGLMEITKRFKLQNVYDLSATPYYLSGSGYDAYLPFPWIVTDFNLVEAIESGLVKIPFLPETDTSQELTVPKLRDIYAHVKDELPKKGQKKKRKEGELTKGEDPPELPKLIKLALEKFEKDYQRHKTEIGSLFKTPPVLIVVCNNTTVSKEVYKYIAGYDLPLQEDNILRGMPGQFAEFSNYDRISGMPNRYPNSLLIDSDALDNSGQIDDSFKTIFKSEIEFFKNEIRQTKGAAAADKLTEAEILREVVNTVGKNGKLGGRIRCVISVSMLSEGWDCGTVTHIMGIRKFGSQLLCEQVAGRALRRVSYGLESYRVDTGEIVALKDRGKFKPQNLIYKFPAEYAHIIGIPFAMFKGGKTGGGTSPQPDKTAVYALPERAGLEIQFPNVIGYRLEYSENITFDLSRINKPFTIDMEKLPRETTSGTAFSNEKKVLNIERLLEQRDQFIIFKITTFILKYHFSDLDGRPKTELFPQLKEFVEMWFYTEGAIRLLNETDEKFKKVITLYDEKEIADHLIKGVIPQKEHDQQQFIRPILNHYNRIGSSKYVNGATAKEVFDNISKSQVNGVVMDSGWEGKAAKTMEDMPEIIAYVKNDFLDFVIPYNKDGKEHKYFPDFIILATAKSGKTVNLILEITGMTRDKDQKKSYTQTYWLPAVNAVRSEFEGNMAHEWHFLEIADDPRIIKNAIFEYLKWI